MRTLVSATLIVVLIFAVAEARDRGKDRIRGCRPIVRTFFQQPVAQQIETFAKYDLAQQYEMFICGNRAIHPPAMYLARAFAQEGKTALPLLMGKLREAEDDLTIRDIILVLKEMSTQGTYAVAADRELMELINSSVRRMKDEGWKEMAQRMVGEMSK